MGESDQSRRLSKRVSKYRYKRPDRSYVGVCTKYTLFFENFLLMFVGLGMAAMGTYILILKKKTVHEIIDFFLDPACDTCLAGCVVFVMGFLGCVGALREITCFLKLYYFLLCVFLLAELVVAILMFVAYYQPDFKSELFPTNAFKNAITNYRNDPDMKNLIDSMQQDLECCGLSDSDEGFLDWNENVYFNCSERNRSPEACSVPFSCCIRESGEIINYKCGASMIKMQNGQPVANDRNTFHIHTKGCIKALGDWFDGHSLIVGGAMLGVLLPQIFVVVLTRNLIDMIAAQKSKW